MKISFKKSIWKANSGLTAFFVSALMLLTSCAFASAQIATGTNHTLAIQNGGTVWAWGYNYYGQLGNNSTTEETTAVEVQTASGALSNVTDVAAGANHSVAVDSSGNAWAWGYNGNGQLGNGTTTNNSVAVQIKTSSGNLTGITAVAAGDNFTLALRNDGTVWAVGTNGNGQLGNGTTTQEITAVQVATSATTYLTNIVAIAAGSTFSMALDGNGNVWTWGYNVYGQLGLGTTTQETYAQEITSITGIGQIAAGADHALAMTTNGSTVYSWGDNQYGQLGNNTTTQENSPVTMIGISNAKVVAAGANHSVILESNGSVWTCGHNYVGELGIGSTIDQHEAVQVTGVSSILAIAARNDRTLMLNNVGAILGAGDDFYGGLGDGKVGYQLSPYSITALSGVTQVSSANDGYHSLVVTSGGAIYAAGWNPNGQLGNNSVINSNTFAQVQTSSGYLTGITASAAGGLHSLALTSGGNVYAWGFGNDGQLGNGSSTSQQLPVEVVNSAGALANVTSVSAGEDHSLALRSDGTVWAWGENSSGQLGNNTTTNSNKAVEVLNTSGTALSNIVAISAGENHNLAVDSSGHLWTWGYNGNGQLGDGTTTNHLEAEEINLSGAVLKTSAGAISGGGFHSLAITSTGTVLAWGNNLYGDLGNGNETQELTPVAVQNLTSVTAIYAGQYHSMAVESNGSVWTWGTNSTGQLGNGTFDLNNHPSPAQLSGITASSGSNPGSCTGANNLLVNSSGVLTTWANGMYGQLGDGQFGYAATPVTAAFAITLDTSGIWVDGTNGLDTNPGTYTSPFKTIAAALTKLENHTDTDTRITIRAGTYYEYPYINGQGTNGARSGTASAPLVIRGMPGERVIISGMKQIKGWSLYQGSIYQVNLGTWNPTSPLPANTYPDTFYVGNSERLMAQWPAPGSDHWIWQSATTSGTLSTTITDTAHLVGVGTLAGGYIQFYGANNSIMGQSITSNNSSAGTLTFPNVYTSENGSYQIKNCLAMLQQPGQWACVPQTGGTYMMYYWPLNSAEITNMLSANPTTQARNGYANDNHNNLLRLYEVSYYTIEGLEFEGCSGHSNAISVEGVCANINILWNSFHDNGGYIWSGTFANYPGGYAVSLSDATGCTITNNLFVLNNNAISIYESSNCVVTQNDIGNSYVDGIDVSSGGSTKPSVNNTISYNYIHHLYNLEQHADAIQPYDNYVEQLNVTNNAIIYDVGMVVNGLGSATYQDNLIWGTDWYALGKTGGTGLITFNDNTIESDTQLGAGVVGSDNTFSSTNNVIWGRYFAYPSLYTGDRNLFQPALFTTGTSPTWDKTQISWGSDGTLGYQTAPPGAIQTFYNESGQDQHSYLPTNPAVTEFANMPYVLADADEVNNMAKFTDNGTSTTVPLTVSGAWQHVPNPSACFAVNDHIEFNFDGVVRTVTAVDSTTNHTITFTPALSQVPGGGNGLPTVPRDDVVEDWGPNVSSFVRNSALASGSPGQTMSASGGPIGSLINLSQYQADDFLGTGESDVPPMPADVQANLQQHNWHIATWFSFGD